MMMDVEHKIEHERIERKLDLFIANDFAHLVATVEDLHEKIDKANLDVVAMGKKLNYILGAMSVLIPVVILGLSWIAFSLR